MVREHWPFSHYDWSWPPVINLFYKNYGLLIETLIIMHTFLGTGHFSTTWDFGCALWLVQSGHHRNEAEQWARWEVEGSNTCVLCQFSSVISYQAIGK